MTRRVYICGDSFCSTDPDYPGGWVEQFQFENPDVEVVNLSSPGASNYLIYLQVKRALADNCEYLIYHATSSVRYEFSLDQSDSTQDSADRYWNRSNPTEKRPMVCTSWVTPENSLVLSDQQSTQIKNFFKCFVDMTAEIEKNYLFIESTLRLIKQQTPHWVWSRGGFEHSKFNSAQHWNFADYQSNEATFNLWDYYDSTQTRPFYHITDATVIKDVCNDYKNMLQL